MPLSPTHCWDTSTSDSVSSACPQTQCPSLVSLCPHSKNSLSHSNASVTVTVPVEAKAEMQLRG